MQDSTDVLIVGAGPVGLLLAAELARNGVAATLIEHHPGRLFFCKALGVTARTIEIFEEIGVAEAAIDAGIWGRGLTVFDNGTRVADMDLPAEGLPYGALMLAQYDTERLLEDALRQFGGAVHYGSTLTGFVQDAEGVTARIADADGAQRELRCRWLVGCDGMHSKVRDGLGLGFEGGQFAESFALADLDVAWDLPRGRLYRFNRTGEGVPRVSMMAVPVHGSPCRYRLSTTLPRAEASTADVSTLPPHPDLDTITAIMKPNLPPGTVLSNLRWSSSYSVSHRIVPHYSEGRVFLAGDAAHVHPPVGGQGMNTGLQDAHNLAWKLMLAARGVAGPTLLDSYSAERHPVGLDVVEQTSQALNDVLAQRAKLPGMRETQLLVGYRGSALVADERPSLDPELPAAGDRAPDADGLRRVFVGHALRLRDRIGRGRHVLVGYLGPDGSGLDALADLNDAARARLDNAAAGLAIAAPGFDGPAEERLPLLNDSAGEFAAAYGAVPGMVWLIRPDGHIGWAGVSPSADVFARALDRCLGLSGAA